jgi:hypothetical protein
VLPSLGSPVNHIGVIYTSTELSRYSSFPSTHNTTKCTVKDLYRGLYPPLRNIVGKSFTKVPRCGVLELALHPRTPPGTFPTRSRQLHQHRTKPAPVRTAFLSSMTKYGSTHFWSIPWPISASAGTSTIPSSQTTSSQSLKTVIWVLLICKS